MAFRAVARHRAPARRTWQVRRSRPVRRVRAAIARVLTIKVAVLATGALGAVGLVYAVSAGNSTTASPFGSENTVHSQTPPAAAQKVIVPSTHASPSARPTSDSGSGQRALCHEYVQQDRHDRTRMLDAPSFAGLRESAGISGTNRDRDRARMDDFCSRVLGRDSGDRSDGSTDNHSGWPDDGHSNDPDPYDPHRPNHPVA